MSDKIDETLKKIAGGTPTGKTPDSPGAWEPPANDLPGDPNCPLCHGAGYLRQDLPLGHPDFGKLEICSCRSGEISQRIHRRLFELSNLAELEQLTFENFQPRGRIGLRPAQADTLELAYNQSRIFAERLEGWLLLQGYYGTGKTHLAAAIANFAVSVGVPTLFLTVPDLLDTLRFAYDNPEATFEERFEQVRTAPLLVLDDFGTQNATAWAQEKLFQILNYRYINHLPLVVTSNLMLDEIEGRIRSRLEDPELVTRVHINATDYRRPMLETGEADLSDLNHYHRMTFDTFELRKSEGLAPEHVKSLERAVDTARSYAEDPRGWLVITGPYGCGKTHLAAAIANYRSDLGYLALFFQISEMMEKLKATFSPTSQVSLERRFEAYRTAQLLVLDDLSTRSMSDWGRDKLFQLFNYRYITELPTVITTADLKEEMDPRLLSRLQDARLCNIVAITAPNYRGVSRPHGRRRTR